MRTEPDPSGALKPLADLSLELAQDLNVDRILQRIVERSMELTASTHGAAVTMSLDGQVDRWLYRGFAPDELERLPQPPSPDGLLGAVIGEGRQVRLEQLAEHPLAPALPEGIEAEAFLGTPLKHARRVVGGLFLTKTAGTPPFTSEDEELVIILASMAAVGIENARLLAAETQRAERGSLLRAIASRVRRSLETSDVLEATVQALGRAASVDRCFIRLAEPEGSTDLGPIVHEWDAPDIEPMPRRPDARYPVMTLSAITRSTQWSQDITNDPRVPFDQTRDLADAGALAVLATPLEWGEELLGVVAFHSRSPRLWTPSDVALIEAAAREVSIAIDHARRYKAAVTTAERLRDLDQLRSDFVSMVSHELRSPMTVIAGISDILEKRHDRLTALQRNELVETLGREARRLRRLVSDVLDLESFEKGAMELLRTRFDIVELARESVADAVEAHRTTVLSDVREPEIDADRDRIKQVLLNLISNASKFSDEDDRITVSVGERDSSVVVAVHDEGPGMTEEQQARLFERFSRVQSGYMKPGTGLGLFLSKQIVEEHGGEIWVESEPGVGSTFSFTIPR